MQRKRGAMLCVVVAFALSVVGSGWAQSSQDLMEALEVKAITPPEQAPEFTALDLHGKSVSLKDLHGKVILLNFWATWCGPCHWEMTEMDTLYHTFKDQGFVVLAIALDAQGAKTVAPFVKERQLTYPVLLDTGLKAARQYGIKGPPSTFLIGRQGELLGVALGPREWAGEKAKALVSALLDTSARR